MTNIIEEIAVTLYNGFCETVKFFISVAIILLFAICIIHFIYVVIDTTIYYVQSKKQNADEDSTKLSRR